jgi:hypothetical protein
MARTIRRTEKRYIIHFINSRGVCYRSLGGCPYSKVVEERRWAKILGETIEVEYERTIVHKYTI